MIKIQGLPSGDFWIGFALMQIAGIAFAFGQIAYRDWKNTHKSVPDSAIFALLTLEELCVLHYSVLPYQIKPL